MKIKPIQVTLFILFLSFFQVSPLLAQGNQTNYREFHRKILGIYDSREDPEAFNYNKIQMHAHMVLNYYGYYVELLDVRKGKLPDREKMQEYAGVITWFNQPSIPNAFKFITWLETYINRNRKLIIFGYTGMEIDEESGQPQNTDFKQRMLALVGLRYYGYERGVSQKVYIEEKDSDMVEFERQFNESPGNFDWVIPANKDVKSWFIIGHDDFPNSKSTVVATSPTGGYVKNGYALWSEDGEAPRRKWLINPFRFFREIFKNNRIPVPDPTTKNGKRVFYSHIDGDAFHSWSRVEKGQYCSDIVEKMLQEFSEIPVGVSIVGAEVDPKEKGNERLVATARRIFSLDNVEIASHTYNHPYIWRGEERTSAYNKEPFDVEEEIKKGVDFINNTLVPPKKKVVALYWTGDTMPSEKAFEVLENLKILNLNGGDGVKDEHFPSYSSVSPLVRNMGKYWQVFTSQSNENLYTALWREDFNGFANVIQTFENTNSPYRLSAVNVYYHFYSGERHSSIEAVKKAYRWALKQDLSFVFPSEYIQMVKGYISTQILILGHNRFRIENRGKLNTLRLDEGSVNREKSTGILDLTKFNDATYISLDPKVNAPIIQVE